MWYTRIAGKTLVVFGRHWRKEWNQERIGLVRQIICMVVTWQLGSKRTTFTWKEVQDHAKTGADLGADASEASNIVLGPAAGKSVRRRWMFLMSEMVVVFALSGLGIGLIGLTTVWKACQVLSNL